MDLAGFADFLNQPQHAMAYETPKACAAASSCLHHWVRANQWRGPRNSRSGRSIPAVPLKRPRDSRVPKTHADYLGPIPAVSTPNVSADRIFVPSTLLL